MDTSQKNHQPITRAISIARRNHRVETEAVEKLKNGKNTK